MSKQTKTNSLTIYQTKSGALQLREDVAKETVCVTLDQIAEVFSRDKSVISLHFKNIYNEGELQKETTVAKNATVQFEGKRKVIRNPAQSDFESLL